MKAQSQSQAEPIDLNSVVNELIERSRQRNDLHRSEKGLTLRIKAIFRRLHGGDKDKANAAYKATIDKWLKQQIKAGFGGDELIFLANQELTDEPARIAFISALPLLVARATLEPERRKHEARMSALATTLPIYPWIAGIRGVSAMSLASVIAETGIPTRFNSVTKLWKRMGLSTICGERQRRCADRDKALLHGFSPQRRSVMWVIGDLLIKMQSDDMPFRALYLKEKAYQKATHPDIRDITAHNRAKRKMEKEFLKQIWRQWHLATTGTIPEPYIPAARDPLAVVRGPMPLVDPVSLEDVAAIAAQAAE
jgi:hypothetical protein